MNAETWMKARRAAIVATTLEYLAIDTTTPLEGAAEPFLRELLGSIGYRLESAGDWVGAAAHPDWSPHPGSQQPHIGWVASPVDTTGPIGPELIVNAHVDVVPSLPDQVPPAEVDGWITGRGACDTKGNLILFVEALRCLQEHGLAPRHPVRFHLPAYEEIGGNGTLALALADAAARPAAAAALCLEPTNLASYVGHRGCLTYRATLRGRAVHMGAQETGLDAIQAAADLIIALRSIESDLVAEAVNDPGFAWTPRPCQLNVGRIEGGEWSGSVAEHCTLTGDVGVSPWYGVADLERRLVEAARTAVGHGITIDWDFRTGLRNEPYRSIELGILADLADASRSGDDRRVWNVSCDARHYARVLDLPTMVFGAGALSSAHARDEQVEIDELLEGGVMVANWLGAIPRSR